MLPIVARSASDMRLTPGAVELDELIDDAVLAQDLRDGEHQVGGRDAGLQLAGQLEADDFRQQHVERLAEHHALRLRCRRRPSRRRPGR